VSVLVLDVSVYELGLGVASG